MATLAGNTIASTYPLLLKIDSNGIDGTLRAVQDGDATDSALKISTGGISVGGTVTVGADDTGYDVIFYGDTASSNMTWDTSGDDLILNDATLKIDQDDNVQAIYIDAESTTTNVIQVDAPSTTTANCLAIESADALTTGSIAKFTSNSSSTGTRTLVNIINDNVSATGATALKVQQDAAQTAVDIDQNANATGLNIVSDATTSYGMVVQGDSLTTGFLGSFYSNSSDTNTRSLVRIYNDHASADNAVCLYIQQDGADASIELGGNGSIKFPGTQGASSDANSLDDYEEGVYDVTVTNDGTGFNMQSNEEAASYTKIGDLVHVQGGVQIASEASATGNIKVSLPFTSGNFTDFSERSYGTVWLVNTSGTNAGHLVAVNNGSEAYFQIGQVADNGTNTYLTAATVDESWFLGFQITFKV